MSTANLSWFPGVDQTGDGTANSCRVVAGAVVGATWTAGQRDNALRFDGVDDRVQRAMNLPAAEWESLATQALAARPFSSTTPTSCRGPSTVCGWIDQREGG